jgi:hypothetical protein
MTDGLPPARHGWLHSRWWRWLGLWTAIGLAVRVGAVLGRPHRVAGGDSYYFHNAANLLVDGKGFVNPFLYYGHHQHVQTAAFPPGFVFVLAAASLIGFKSYFAHRIWCCVIGSAAVAVCGLTGREISGPRVGLVTAFVIAVYPNIWMSDEMAMSETLSPLLVALVLLTAYRFWKNPGLRNSVWLGLSVGLAALVRDELSMLGPLVLIPVVLTARSLPWRRRVVALGTGALCALLVIAPWAGYNMSRFQDPVFISTGLGPTLASTNCGSVYSGPYEGYWSMSCALAAPSKLGVDESVESSAEQSYALKFVRSHENRLIPVVAARIGRTFGLFHPIQQIRLDWHIETRPYHWALLGLWMYYGLALLSIAGAVILRLRRVPVFPLLAVGLTVVISIILSFGDTRYRTTFEVSTVLLASVALEHAWTARLQRRNPPSERGLPGDALEPALSAPGG